MANLIVYGLPSLVATIFNFSLYIYLLYRNPRSRINRVLGHFFFAISIMCLGDFFTKLSGINVNNAISWHIMTMLGATTASFFYIYFALIFPREPSWTSSLRGRSFFAILLISNLSLFFYATYRGVTTVLSPDLKGAEFYSLSALNAAMGGSTNPFGIIFLFSQLFAGLFILIYKYLKERGPNRNSILPLLHGGIILILLGFISEGIFPMFGFEVPGIFSLGTILNGLLTVYVITRYKEFGLKATPESVKGTSDKKLEGSSYYIVVEDNVHNPERSYEIFCSHAGTGILGLVITTRDAKEIRTRYGLEKTAIMQLSTREGFDKRMNGSTKWGQNAITFGITDLRGAMAEAQNFVRRNPGCIVVMDCLGDLITENGRTSQSRSMLLQYSGQFLREIITNKSILLVPEDHSWLTQVPNGGVLKVQTLLRATSYWAFLLLESLINSSVSGLGQEQRARVWDSIQRIARVNSVFERVTNEGGIFFVQCALSDTFTVQDALYNFKEFYDETERNIMLNTTAIASTLERFGIGKYEQIILAGNGYLLYTKDGRTTINDLLMDFLQHGYRVLFVTRNHPRETERLPARMRLGLRVLWMTNVVRGNDTVPPRLEHIQMEVESFVSQASGQPFIVILDNLTYLVKHTGSFDEVHLFIANLRDLVCPGHGSLVVPIEREALSDREHGVLLQELQQI